VVLIEEISAAGDEVAAEGSGPVDDALEGRAEILTPAPGPHPEQALAGEGMVEVKVGKMEKAKAHRMPARSEMVAGAKSTRNYKVAVDTWHACA
jgi:hypothetical protein